MARQYDGRQTWGSLKCAKCSGASAEPFRATCVNSQLIQVDIRCPDCRHEWQLTRNENEALPPAMTLPLRFRLLKPLGRA